MSANEQPLLTCPECQIKTTNLKCPRCFARLHTHEMCFDAKVNKDGQVVNLRIRVPFARSSIS